MAPNFVTSLAERLFRDDLSRAGEVPIERDGEKAYDGWLKSAVEAGDRDTYNDLEAVERNAFATAWEWFVTQELNRE